MRKITAFLFYCLLPLFVFSQTDKHIDSLTFAHQEWATKTIGKGIVWKTSSFPSIFGSQQIINIIEVNLKKNQKKLALKALPAGRELTSKLAKEADALAAINGGFFDMKNGGAVDFIKVNNQVINHTRSKSSRGAYFAFDKKRTIIADDSVLVASYPNVMLAGPMLIKDNSTIPLAKNAFNDNRHPRTALGIKEDILVMITIDGRRSQSQGVSLHELTNLLRWYGCQDGMNLDGGGSTTMYIYDQPHNGVVNYPSDNQKFDHEGERKVSNIIYIIK